MHNPTPELPADEGGERRDDPPDVDDREDPVAIDEWERRGELEIEIDDIYDLTS